MSRTRPTRRACAPRPARWRDWWLAGGQRVHGAWWWSATGRAPVTPCGGCRQKLREFAADDVPVMVADANSVRARFTLGELLPAQLRAGAHLA